MSFCVIIQKEGEREEQLICINQLSLPDSYGKGICEVPEGQLRVWVYAYLQLLNPGCN